MRSSKLKDRRRRKPTLHRRDRINILLDVLLSSIADYYIYIDTDEIPGFVLLLKNHISPRAVKILFLSFMCEDIGVAMVTNIITQLQ